ncbi:MAG: hypothetical protein MUP85_16255 [Candidatus Lokiarchaeota archaeon]|nr:hypothetical protein [Candidatus Lokiarchaeota archaeon]
MSDQLKLIMYLKIMISDLIYINSIMATELIKINENLAVLRHGEEFLKNSSCIDEHSAISKHIIKIVDKYNKADSELLRKEDLEKHVLKHD